MVNNWVPLATEIRRFQRNTLYRNYTVYEWRKHVRFVRSEKDTSHARVVSAYFRRVNYINQRRRRQNRR